MSSEHNQGEEIRLRYLYRKLIMEGRIRLPLESARKLLGPDCAYHLYGQLGRVVAQNRDNRGEQEGG